MRLHTDGNSITLLSPKGRLHWQESGKLSSEPPLANVEISDEERSGMLCITPKGERDFSARLTAAGALAADAIDEETVAALIVGQDSLYLVRGPVTMDAEWPSIIDVATLETTKVSWPDGLIWKKGDSSLYDMAHEHGHGIPELFVPSIECNRHGTAVASRGTGTVLVVRPGSRTPDFCLQLPSQEEAAIFACPTASGVLVTLIVDGQDSAIVHLDQDGGVLGHRALQSAVPTLALDKGFLIYNEDNQSIELLDTSLATLTKKKIPWAALDSASAHDGTSFAFADAEHVLRGHVNAKSELIFVAEFDYSNHESSGKTPGEHAAAEAKWDPERCHGRPTVGFAAGIRQEPWTATNEKSFTLELYARSTGGKGQGITISIGGDAIKHCTFKTVAIAETKVELSLDDKGNYTAAFPRLELVQGLVYPLNPKPKNDAQKHAATVFLEETHIKLVLTGNATAVSSDLMSVSIAALRSDSPPLKWMRPLTIS